MSDKIFCSMAWRRSLSYGDAQAGRVNTHGPASSRSAQYLALSMAANGALAVRHRQTTGVSSLSMAAVG
jgi:hypothetical protein